MKPDDLQRVTEARAKAWQSITTFASVASDPKTSAELRSTYVKMLLGQIEAQKKVIDRFIDSIRD